MQDNLDTTQFQGQDQHQIQDLHQSELPKDQTQDEASLSTVQDGSNEEFVQTAEFTDIPESNMQDPNSNINFQQPYQPKQLKQPRRWQVSRDLDLEIEGRGNQSQ
eukprot:TRINITY_DN1494_c0_g1_i6.p3 TRINITY_DN1494_c0_g1~~TRINITY_DN1494_c0_g1_i6.p3  ORF type:complete len:105 (-),score=11.79 TRINITY_DN1494_c0_g1_i6:125-439(-)